MKQMTHKWPTDRNVWINHRQHIWGERYKYLRCFLCSATSVLQRQPFLFSQRPLCSSSLDIKSLLFWKQWEIATLLKKLALTPLAVSVLFLPKATHKKWKNVSVMSNSSYLRPSLHLSLHFSVFSMLLILKSLRLIIKMCCVLIWQKDSPAEWRV